MKNRETYVVFILDCWAIPGYSILKTVSAIRDLNMLKLRVFVHYKTKPVLELLGVCEQTSYVSGGFRFFWISWKLTPCISPVMCWKQWESQDAGQCLKSLEISKEAFDVFRRIKSENSWKWNKFKEWKNISRLPDHRHKTQRISLSFQISSHLFSDSDHFFRDPWVPLTFFPAATLVAYNILIKIREKKNKQCFESTLGKRAYKAFEWEAKFVWVMRGVLSDVDYF